MKKQWETFQELTSDASTFLREKLSRSDVTINRYHFYWRKIEKYMKAQQFTCFDISVGEGFLRDKFGGRDYPELSRHEKDQIKGLNVLCEFYRTGAISFLSKEETSFEGSIGQLMIGYLSHLASLRLKATTTFEYERHLSRFLCYLNKNKVDSIQVITQAHILNFIKGIDPRFPSLVHTALQTIRCFLKYLKEQNIIEINLYAMIPRDNYKNQKKLPSCYSPKEIELMIAIIDRGNPAGKRNYAIVMLAARLGLRASDIAGLRFENLFWEESKIVFNQYKTGNEIELPLLPDVGNAIIDYLKYGRPKSNDAYVFLCTMSPYTRIYSCSITGVVHKALVRAGISIENRKHGPHALRHSLAGILLEKGTIVPVISEVLGHKNTESTNYYLRIDLKSMRQCALKYHWFHHLFMIRKEVIFMSRKFSGVYAPYIEQYIALRRELGFKCELEENIFFLFDRFTIERGEKNVGITKELADNWNIKPPNESDSYRYRRALTIRQLASFLCQIGIRSYIPQLPPFKSTFTPYIFSKIEIDAIFKAVDELRGKKKA